MSEETEPVPSKCPGWYLADEKGRHAYTMDPEQAARRPVTSDAQS